MIQYLTLIAVVFLSGCGAYATWENANEHIRQMDCAAMARAHRHGLLGRIGHGE